MKNDNKTILLDVSWSALLKILALLIGLWAIIALKDVIIMMFVVFIFVGAVGPTISKLQKWMSRALAVGLVYALILLLVVFVSYLFIPPLIDQINDLIRQLPIIFGHLKEYATAFRSDSYSKVIDQGLGSFSNGLSSISGNLFGLTMGVFGGVATFITGLVLSFYLLLEEKNARVFFNQILPKNRFEAVYTTVMKMSDRMGAWARGQLTLMGIIAVANLILLAVVGMPSFLPLAIWAGLCEIIPYVGPLLGILPAVIVALATGSILKAVLVLAISIFVIQQAQGHFVVPKVMSKALGLSPVLVILAIVVGAKLYGLMGALIAIPAAAVISVVVGEWQNLRKLWEEDKENEKEAI